MTLYSMLHTMVSPITKGIYRMRVIGTEHIPATGKMILCSNHRSVMDPILLGVSGKAVNRFLRTLGAFPVKRGSGDTKAIEQAIEILEQGGLLGIFPQGGIVAHGIPFQPKSGIAMIAYHAKAPVLPVGIDTNGDIKALKPVTIRFGRPIAYEEFGFTDGSRKEMKYAAHVIAERVNQLLEAKE